MSGALRIGVVTPLFPTAGEPYRGAPIWKTLEALSGLARLTVLCPQPRYPAMVRPRSFRYRPEEADGSAYGLTARTVPYFSVPGLTRAINGGSIARKLARAAAPGSFDLLLSYWLHPDGYAAVRLAERWGIPAVVSSRGSDLRVQEWMTRPQLRYTVRRAAGVICVSGDLREHAIALGARPERTHTVINGVDTGVFHWRDRAAMRARLGLEAGARWVVFVGWLSELKGVPQLVEAAAALGREGEPWQVALIGEGYLEARLREQARALGIESRVRFLGGMRAAQVAEWVSAADLLSLPSATEGCPNVLLEAAACGTPVVATAVGGIPEVVDENSGVLIERQDSRLLAAGIAEAGRRQWDREAIARRGQRGWDAVARDTYRICENACKKGKR